MGRKKLTHPRSKIVQVRAQEAQARAWARAAKSAGKSLTAWLRDLANHAAGFTPKEG